MARRQATFEVFRGTLASWHTLFSEAAAFATEVGPRRLISISHSEDRNEGVVTVWYWATASGDAQPDEELDDWIRDDQEAVEWKPGREQEPQ
jgi:hypothetical protein